LSRIDLATGRQYLGQAAHGPDSIIVLDGAPTLTARGRSILLARGAIVLVPFGTHYSLNAGVIPAMLFKASVPGHTDFVHGSE
jgi:mannose-6-phosphate isomerase-like protein (cupin superfamily)